MKTRTRHVVCWLEPHFNLIDVASFCQVLSVAGSNWNWRPYRLSFASTSGGVVTSSAQVRVDTVPLASCDLPDVVIVSSSAPTGVTSTDAPFATWQVAVPFWVALRGSLPTLVKLNVPLSTVAVSPPHQALMRELVPGLQFSSKDFHEDGQVLSCGTLDVLPAALALLEKQIGHSARRYVETQLGLTQTAVALHGLDKLRP